MYMYMHKKGYRNMRFFFNIFYTVIYKTVHPKGDCGHAEMGTKYL